MVERGPGYASLPRVSTPIPPIPPYPAAAAGTGRNPTRRRKMRVDNPAGRRSLVRSLHFAAMTNPETTPRSLTPPEVPFTNPQMFNRCVTDTGKILPRKYTGLSSKHQRAVTKTLKRSRDMLLAK
jgi:small subunit ribosomal protein S18